MSRIAICRMAVRRVAGEMASAASPPCKCAAAQPHDSLRAGLIIVRCVTSGAYSSPYAAANRSGGSMYPEELLRKLSSEEEEFISLFREYKLRTVFTAADVENSIIKFENLPMVVSGKVLAHGFLVLKNGHVYTALVQRQLQALLSRCAALEAYTADSRHGGMALNHIAVSLGSLRHLDAESHMVRQLLRFLTIRIKKVKPVDAFLNHQLANALYGLRRMDSNIAAVRELVAALALKIPQCRDPFTGGTIGNCLYGLQRMRSSSPEVRDLLTALAEKIEESVAHMNSKDIGSALYGFQNLMSSSKEVRYLLAVLTERIAASQARLMGVSVDNALYGLQNMTCESQKVRNLLSTLAAKIRESDDPLTATHFSNALYGLQRMTATVPESRALLSAIISKAPGDNEPFTAHNIAVAMYGIQSMGNAHIECCQALSYLTGRLERCNEVFNSIALSNSVLGMKNMNGNSHLVHRLLSALAVKLRHPNATVDGQGVGNMLLGARHCKSDSVACRELVAALAAKIAATAPHLAHTDVGRALAGLHLKDPVLDPSIYDLLWALLPCVKNCNQVFAPNTISCMIYGMRHLDPSHAAVVGIMEEINSKWETLRSDLSSLELGKAFLGLQNMSSNSLVVQSLLQGLLVQLYRCQDMHPLDICNIYTGIQNMTLRHSEVLKIHDVASQRLLHITKSGSTNFTSTGLCRILSSLRNVALPGTLGSDSIKSTLRSAALLLKINSLDVIAPKDLCAAVGGFQRMSSQSKEVTELLQMLADAIKNSKTSFSTSDIAAAAVGIVRMDPSHGATKSIVVTLSRRIKGIAESRRRTGRGTIWAGKDLLTVLTSVKALGTDCREVAGFLRSVHKSLGGSSCMQDREGNADEDITIQNGEDISYSNSNDTDDGNTNSRVNGIIRDCDKETLAQIYSELLQLGDIGSAITVSIRELESLDSIGSTVNDATE